MMCMHECNVCGESLETDENEPWFYGIHPTILCTPCRDAANGEGEIHYIFGADLLEYMPRKSGVSSRDVDNE